MANEIKWSIDQAHSEIGFKVKHLMIANIKGMFKTFDASIYTTGNDFTTVVVDLWIDATSIETGDLKRDEHLKSADFLDVARYKQLTFTASTMSQMAVNGNYELWGELTIKGITKNVKMDVQLGGIVNEPLGRERAGFNISTSINRMDWGLNWNTPIETGGFLLGDEILISVDLELISIAPKETDVKMVLETTHFTSKSIF
jgi:polyisoprenoid-binding protein YceI